MTEHAPGRTVKSVERMIRLVEVIDELNGARLTELADQSGLAKSTVHGYVSTLESEGYLVKEGDQYHLGLRFLHLGSVAKHRKPLYRLADKMTRELSVRTDLSADFIVEQNDRLVSVSCYQSGKQSSVGVYFDYHNSASGKAILMRCSEAEITEKVELNAQLGEARGSAVTATDVPFDSRPGKTDNTITSETELREELERSHERGYAVNDREIHEGLWAIATPIVAPSGTTLGALSVAGASYRLTDDATKSEAVKTLLEIRNEFETEVSSAIEYQY